MGARRRALALALAAAAAGGCGYRLAGGNATIPDHVRRIAVPAFDNRTQQPDIAQRLSERVVDEFIARGGFIATASAEQADALLRGAVTLYRSVPVAIDDQGLATRYEIQLELEAELVDLGDERVLWKDDHFVFRAQYDVEQDPALYFDQTIVGIEKVSLEAARSVVASILEGF
jgi:outer membrane lipopolysaccharide assembly protein LptE/RlpB